jgi:zinc transport system substrate-binding protein
MIKIILRICIFVIIFFNNCFAQDSYKTGDNIKTNNTTPTAQLKDISKGDVVLSKAPKIASSINPIYQIAKFISGDDKSNYLLINPRVSEHDYQFKVSNINTLNQVDVVFYIDDGLENYFSKALVSLTKKPKIVQLAKSKYVKLLTFQSRANEENVDYHIWMNPQNAIGIAGEIAQTLSSLYPSSALTYKQNLQLFIADIKKMDEENKIKLLKIKPKIFIVDHDGIAYFENYYGLPAAGVIKYYHDQELTIKDIERINNVIKTNKVVCVLGSFQERNGSVVQIANNNKIKLVLTDIIGSEINDKKNGYTQIVSGFVDDLVKCADTK